jgi:hypothetical protein
VGIDAKSLGPEDDIDENKDEQAKATQEEDWLPEILKDTSDEQNTGQGQKTVAEELAQPLNIVVFLGSGRQRVVTGDEPVTLEVFDHNAANNQHKTSY